MRRFETRESRFSNRVLLTYAACSLPETLALRAAAEDDPAEILLYDEIGFWGVTATDFAAALSKAGDGPLTLRINSPGGDVFDGYAIYNMLRARAAPVNVVIDGIAASAASFIAMAGSTITMGEPSMLMIHNSWGLCVGDRNDMLDMAATQEKIDGQIAGIYAGKCGKPVAEIAAMMDDETWLTSGEAKAQNFCDAVTGTPEPATSNALPARFRALARVGARVRNAVEPYDPDGDGDNDAEEASEKIISAQALLSAAISALNGTDADDEDEPQNRTRRAPRVAATTPEWVCGASRTLPIDTASKWDGPAAAERILDDAGFNGESPDPAKAKLGFLAWDHHNPKLKGSYKLPFADIVSGKLTALKSGIDAAASRLPDTDIPDAVKTEARAVLDAYETRDKPDNAADAALEARARRLRLAAARAF